MKACLEIFANLASILTAIVAAWAAAYYWCDKRNKRTKMESYLKAEKRNNPSQCEHTVLHLMAKLGLTESEILSASFASSHISRKEHVNKATNLTDEILFEYQEHQTSN